MYTEKLAGKFVTELALLLAKFNGIDTTKSDWESLAEARGRIESDADREAFIKGGGHRRCAAGLDGGHLKAGHLRHF